MDIDSIGFIADNETSIDMLNTEPIAKTIVQLISEVYDGPMSIGIHGDWGAGKSSILEMIEAQLKAKDDETIICLKFNGWQFQGFEDAKIAVIETIVNELIENTSLMEKAKEKVKSIFRRIDWLKMAKKAGSLAFTAYTGIPSLILGDLLGKLSSLKGSELESKITEIQEYIKKENEVSKRAPQEIQEFRKEFNDLLAKAKISKLIVLIDDLDRCLPETIIETLEAIRLFLFLPKTAFIVGADEEMIKYAVRHHFPDIPESNNAAEYANNYLEKLIQIPFRIPALGITETQIYITLLLLKAKVTDNIKFQNVITLGKNVLCKPWEGGRIDEQQIFIELGNTKQIKDAIALAEQIAPTLSAGTRGNPRQIKRFLNALNIRLCIAKSRGFDSEVNPAYLAKLMLAELYLKPLFDIITTDAVNSPDGVCEELKYFESLGSSMEEVNDNSNLKTEKLTHFPNIESWRTSADILQWSKIEPKFASVNLKPYLFIIQDKKNYFSSSIGLSPRLLQLLGKLIGGEVLAASCSNELSKLTVDEIDILFQQLKTSVRMENNFDNPPKPIYGIQQLVKANSNFQIRYVELLKSIQITKLGGWVLSGHEFINIEPAKSALEDFQREVGKSGNPTVQSLANFGSKISGRKS